MTLPAVTYRPPPLSDDDWENITERGALVNAEGELDKEHFMLVIKEQLKAYMLSELVNSMAVADPIQVSVACAFACACVCVCLCVCVCVRARACVASY